MSVNSFRTRRHAGRVLTKAGSQSGMRRVYFAFQTPGQPATCYLGRPHVSHPRGQSSPALAPRDRLLPAVLPALHGGGVLVRGLRRRCDAAGCAELPAAGLSAALLARKTRLFETWKQTGAASYFICPERIPP
jgi:hypothetical protein